MVETGARRRWNERYRARAVGHPDDRFSPPPGPPRALDRLVAMVPPEGIAIDLAGGDGGGAIWLAERGLDVTLVDIADVGLARAADVARARSLPVRGVPLDLEGRRLGAVLAHIGTPRPALVTCFNYLDRALLESVDPDLPRGTRFMVAVATTKNLERHRRPSARFLLDPGELSDLVCGPRVRVLHRREGWADDRHHAELVVEAR